jgi:hypothetical protein
LTPRDICESPGKWWYISGISGKRRLMGLSPELGYFLSQALLVWLDLHGDLSGAGEINFVAEGTTPAGENLLRRFVFELVSVGEADDEKPRYLKRTSIDGMRAFMAGASSTGLQPRSRGRRSLSTAVSRAPGTRP